MPSSERRLIYRFVMIVRVYKFALCCVSLRFIVLLLTVVVRQTLNVVPRPEHKL